MGVQVFRTDRIVERRLEGHFTRAPFVHVRFDCLDDLADLGRLQINAGNHFLAFGDQLLDQLGDLGSNSLDVDVQSFLRDTCSLEARHLPAEVFDRYAFTHTAAKAGTLTAEVHTSYQQTCFFWTNPATSFRCLKQLGVLLQRELDVGQFDDLIFGDIVFRFSINQARRIDLFDLFGFRTHTLCFFDLYRGRGSVFLRDTLQVTTQLIHHNSS
ncbi:hypothetical protein D3C80_1238240 [compost metagenome]